MSNFQDPMSEVVRQLVRQLAYTNLLLMITLPVTFGEKKISSTIKKSQNIVNTIVVISLIVVEWPLRHSPFMKLCKCSQILYPSPRVAATTSRAKTNHYWLNLPHALNYTTPLFEGLRTSFPPYQKIWSSPHFHIPLINSRNKKDRTLDSPSIIVSFSNTEKKGINSSTR